MDLNEKRDIIKGIYYDLNHPSEAGNDLIRANKEYWETNPYGSGFHGKEALGLSVFRGTNSVCDVGCGTGDFLLAMHNNGINTLYGVDIVKSAIIEDRIRGKNITIFESPSIHIPLADKSVDVVTCFDVMEHLLEDDIIPTCREFDRIAKKAIVTRIAYRPEKYAGKLAPNLHITIKPNDWWEKTILENIRECKYTVENRYYLQFVFNESC